LEESKLGHIHFYLAKAYLQSRHLVEALKYLKLADTEFPHDHPKRTAIAVKLNKYSK